MSRLGSRVINGALSAVAAFTIVLVGAAGARAETTFLPSPGPDQCAASFTAANVGAAWPNGNTWTSFKLTVTNYATITTAQALVGNDPSTKPVQLVFRANDGTVGTANWTVIGTMTLASSAAVGVDFRANFTGAITVSPGTYWVSLQAASAAATAGQGLCLHTAAATQSPWSVAYSASPNRYATANNGATYTPVTDAPGVLIPLLTLSGNENPAPSASGPTPPPVLQQIPMPTTGTCAEVNRPDLNWAEVASTGWGSSWAQWVNDGAGGPVCTRTLVYHSSRGRWVIG